MNATQAGVETRGGAALRGRRGPRGAGRDRAGLAIACLAAAGLVLAPAPAAWACTTFLLQDGDEVAVGNSYDWSMGVGQVIINARGLAKSALVMPGNVGVAWTSALGSITFNQYGREQPQSGMNEAGLVVAQMWLDETGYPAADERPAIGELQWVQYALDNFESVEELIAAAPALRVSTFYGELHYLACDAAGSCATFEYLGGELVVASGSDLVVPTLTNSTYEESVDYLVQHVGFGGDLEIPTSQGSLDRFVRASSLAREPVAGEIDDAVFSVLDSVFNSSTQWNLVYLPGRGRVAFRTRDRRDVRTVDLADFDLDCTAEAMVLDVDADLSGPVGDRFEPYTTEANRAIVEEVMGGSFPPLIIGLLAEYPESLTCTLEPGDGGPDGDADADGDGDADGDAGGDAAADGDTPDGSRPSDGCSCSAGSTSPGAAGSALGRVALALLHR